VLVNSADDPEHCDLYLTSVHRSGPVTVSVSSSGTSPALARWLRNRLGREVGPEYARLAMLLHECRADLHARGLSTMDRDWEMLLTDELLDCVREGDEARARSIIERWNAIPA
jgi:precorrin-2 dehydrogenase/sirohydrochlorin ferrochelatase